MKMAIERIYNVPLRKGFQKAGRHRKTKKAVIVLKEFLARHMKCDKEDVRLGRMLNMKLWERGIKNPPHHVKVTVVKDDDGIVKAELFGFKYEESKDKDKKEEKEAEQKESKKPEDKDIEKLEKELDDVLSEKTEEKTASENKV